MIEHDFPALQRLHERAEIIDEIDDGIILMRQFQQGVLDDVKPDRIQKQLVHQFIRLFQPVYPTPHQQSVLDEMHDFDILRYAGMEHLQVAHIITYHQRNVIFSRIRKVT